MIGQITVVGRYDVTNRKPIIAFQINDTFGAVKEIIVDAESAKNFGLEVVRQATSIDADAFMINYMRDNLGVTDDKIQQLLAEFRDMRIRVNGEF